MHCWSWAFLQNCQKSTIPKNSKFVKWAHSFPLDLSLHHCPSASASAMCPFINFIILFDFLLNYFIFNQIKSNKIQILITWSLFGYFRTESSSSRVTNSYQAFHVQKDWVLTILEGLVMVNQIKFQCIDAEGFRPYLLP